MGAVPQKFAFQRLEVYEVAKAVAQLIIEQRHVWAELPGEIGERISRATVNVLAEIAAGAAHTQKSEQKRHFQLARAAANEAMSCIELALLYGSVPNELREMLTAQLARVDTMLTGMVRRRSG